MSATPKTAIFISSLGVRKDARSAPIRVQVTLVAISDRNGRVGETHPNAKFSDATVEAIRDAYEAGVDGTGPRLGYKALAKQYGMSKRTIRDIVHYVRRNGWADRWKRVEKK
jgi:hypothetical protein